QHKDPRAATNDLATAARHLKSLKPPKDIEASAAALARDLDLAAESLQSTRIGAFQSQVNDAARLAGKLGLDVCQNGPRVRSASIPPADARTLLTYTGGRAGAADRRATPVVLGYVNDARRGPIFDREATAAVALVNRQLSGIDGHPIRLHPCTYFGASDAA